MFAELACLCALITAKPRTKRFRVWLHRYMFACMPADACTMNPPMCVSLVCGHTQLLMDVIGHTQVFRGRVAIAPIVRQLTPTSHSTYLRPLKMCSPPPQALKP